MRRLLQVIIGPIILTTRKLSSLQARIGNMDGVIVAYHNTIKIMGFQYFSVDAMEKRVYGESGYGERIFQQTLKLLEETLDVAASIFPESVRVLR